MTNPPSPKLLQVLFDTSSARAVPSRVVSELVEVDCRPRVSPFAAWEMLCRLDRADEFDEIRLNLEKLLKFEFFDDPIALTEAALGLAEPKRSPRTPDPQLLVPLLRRVQESQSLAEFYSRALVLGDGDVRLVEQSAERARIELDREAQRFRELLQRIGQHALAAYGQDLSVERRLSMVLSLARGDLVRAHRERQHGVTLESVAELKFCFWAYVVDRAIRSSGRLEQMARNDYEDAQLLLHVRLGEPMIVVSEDQKLRIALNSALELSSELDDMPRGLVRVVRAVDVVAEARGLLSSRLSSG